MNYLEQINRAIDYIEENLMEDLIMDVITKEAGISKWHFQRVFRAVVGETVKDYSLKRRLSLAAKELLETERTIIDIALDYKFESHEVFTRAFKRIYEVNPSAFRKSQKNKQMIPSKPRITWDYLSHLYEGVTMEPIIKKMDQMSVMGVSGHIKSVQDPHFTQNFEIIPKIWRNLRLALEVLPSSVHLQRVSLIVSLNSHDFNSELEYFAGVVINEKDLNQFKKLEKRIVHEGDYAEFIHKGPVNEINHTMNYIYGSWFPQSGRKRAEGPDVNIYSNASPMSADNEIKIYIPLK